MSFSDSAAASAANPHAPAQDTQKLIALLGHLMPLLLRMQSQGVEAPGPFAAPNLMLDNPIVDQQAATSLVEDITADSLRTLSAYPAGFPVWTIASPSSPRRRIASKPAITRKRSG
jgi:hypothetical protein